MLTAEQGSYVEIGDVRTFYVKLGEGPAVVLVHADQPGACTLVDWACNLEPLAEAGFTVYGFDQPGFGRSGDAEEASLDYRAAHVRGFINALELDSFAVIGASQGAYVAARLAVEDARAHQLVLVAADAVAPPGSPHAEAMAKANAERLGAYTPSPENALALTMQTLYDKARMTADVIRERYLMSVRQHTAGTSVRTETSIEAPHEILRKVMIPTLIVWGAQDDRAPVERALLLQEAIPGSEVHVFDRCGHWVQWDQAERFNALVREFLLR